jgi:hypothetical protein
MSQNISVKNDDESERLPTRFASSLEAQVLNEIQEVKCRTNFVMASGAYSRQQSARTTV